MTRTHVPVLAGELIELTDPHPGETVVDCTFGGGGHARLVADRIGRTGTLVCIDRDPTARAIVRRRKAAPLETTFDLVDTIKSAVPAAKQFGGGHPAKRVFQAIRIAVNDELGALDRGLPAAWDLLRENGRLAAISFHSLEDRRVKRYLADRARGCVCPPDFPICVCGRTPEAELVTTRAVAPTPGEVAANPRAESGKLRVGRKLESA